MKADVTKKLIADTFIDLVSKKSLDKISVHDISEKCDINRKTFYYHFEDKIYLLYWIFDTYCKPLMLKTSNNNYYISTVFANYLIENKKFYAEVFKSQTGEYLINYITELCYKSLKSELFTRLKQSPNVSEYELSILARLIAHGDVRIMIDLVLDHEIYLSRPETEKLSNFVADFATNIVDFFCSSLQEKQ